MSILFRTTDARSAMWQTRELRTSGHSPAVGVVELLSQSSFIWLRLYYCGERVVPCSGLCWAIVFFSGRLWKKYWLGFSLFGFILSIKCAGALLVFLLNAYMCSRNQHVWIYFCYALGPLKWHLCYRFKEWGAIEQKKKIEGAVTRPYITTLAAR